MDAKKVYKGANLEEISFSDIKNNIKKDEKNHKQLNVKQFEKENNVDSKKINILGFLGNGIMLALGAIASIYIMLFAEIFSSSSKPKKRTKRKYYYSWRKGWY